MATVLPCWRTYSRNLFGVLVPTDNASSRVVLLGGGTERWRLGWVRLSVAVVLGGGRGLSGGNRGVWGRERGGGTKEELLRRRVGGMVSVPGGGGLRVRF